jgi:hypothetical protein
MSKIYNNGIVTTAGFQFNADLPLDDRLVVETNTDLASLNRYEGMIVYVKNEQKHYTYINGSWSLFSGEETDLSGYATENFVQNAIEKIPSPDLTDYAKKSDIPNLNIENGEGVGSLQQVVYEDDSKKSKATGKGAIAFGGFRGDKPNGTPNSLPGFENENIDNPVDDTISLAAGIQSAVFGAGNRAYGNWDFVAGKDNLTFGKSTYTFGNGNIVGDKDKNNDYTFSIAIGADNIVKANSGGNCMAAIGSGNKVYGKYGTAIGISNVLGDPSNQQLGGYSLVGGMESVATGEHTFTYGYNLINNSLASATFGAWNEGKADMVLELGWGSRNNRKNVFEVTNTGVARAYGTPVDDNDLVPFGYMKQYIRDNFATLMAEYLAENAATADDIKTIF